MLDNIKNALFGRIFNCFKYDKFSYKKRGFTLAEVLIALVIVGVIAVAVIPVVTTRSHNKAMELTYDTQVKGLVDSFTSLPIAENKTDFTKTIMYTDTDSGDYTSTSGQYLRKYMKVSKYCGNDPGDCFANKYYTYDNKQKKEFDISGIKGACAVLKNGVSICLKPQVGNNPGGENLITGWMDINGSKGPNIYGRDLRTFLIDGGTKVAFSAETDTVVPPPVIPPQCEGGSCTEVVTPHTCTDPNEVSPACCAGKTITGKNDPCCKYKADAKCADSCTASSTDLNCCLKKAGSNSISGPGDACCNTLRAEGLNNKKCCSASDDSTFCCSVNGGVTQACCNKLKTSGLIADPSHACCTNFLKDDPVCKPDPCSKNGGNTEYACLNCPDRKAAVANPEDYCCKYYNSTTDTSNKCCLKDNTSADCCSYKWKDACCSDRKPDDFAAGSAAKNTYLTSCCTYYSKYSASDYQANCCGDFSVNTAASNDYRRRYNKCCKASSSITSYNSACCYVGSSVSKQYLGKGYRYVDGKTKDDAGNYYTAKGCCNPNDTEPSEFCCQQLLADKSSDAYKAACCQYDSLKNNNKCKCVGANADKPENASSCCASGDTSINCCANKSWSDSCCTAHSRAEYKAAGYESKWLDKCCAQGVGAGKYTADEFNDKCCKLDAYKDNEACCKDGDITKTCCKKNWVSQIDSHNLKCCAFKDEIPGHDDDCKHNPGPTCNSGNNTISYDVYCSQSSSGNKCTAKLIGRNADKSNEYELVLKYKSGEQRITPTEKSQTFNMSSGIGNPLQSCQIVKKSGDTPTNTLAGATAAKGDSTIKSCELDGQICEVLPSENTCVWKSTPSKTNECPIKTDSDRTTQEKNDNVHYTGSCGGDPAPSCCVASTGSTPKDYYGNCCIWRFNHDEGATFSGRSVNNWGSKEDQCCKDHKDDLISVDKNKYLNKCCKLDDLKLNDQHKIDCCTYAFNDNSARAKINKNGDLKDCCSLPDSVLKTKYSETCDLLLFKLNCGTITQNEYDLQCTEPSNAYCTWKNNKWRDDKDNTTNTQYYPTTESGKNCCTLNENKYVETPYGCCTWRFNNETGAISTDLTPSDKDVDKCCSSDGFPTNALKTQYPCMCSKEGGQLTEACCDYMNEQGQVGPQHECCQYKNGDNPKYEACSTDPCSYENFDAEQCCQLKTHALWNSGGVMLSPEQRLSFSGSVMGKNLVYTDDIDVLMATHEEDDGSLTAMAVHGDWERTCCPLNSLSSSFIKTCCNHKLDDSTNDYTEFWRHYANDAYDKGGLNLGIDKLSTDDYEATMENVWAEVCCSKNILDDPSIYNSEKCCNTNKRISELAQSYSEKTKNLNNQDVCYFNFQSDDDGAAACCPYYTEEQNAEQTKWCKAPCAQGCKSDNGQCDTTSCCSCLKESDSDYNRLCKSTGGCTAPMDGFYDASGNYVGPTSKALNCCRQFLNGSAENNIYCLAEDGEDNYTVGMDCDDEVADLNYNDDKDLINEFAYCPAPATNAIFKSCCNLLPDSEKPASCLFFDSQCSTACSSSQTKSYYISAKHFKYSGGSRHPHGYEWIQDIVASSSQYTMRIIYTPMEYWDEGKCHVESKVLKGGDDIFQAGKVHSVVFLKNGKPLCTAGLRDTDADTYPLNPQSYYGDHYTYEPNLVAFSCINNEEDDTECKSDEYKLTVEAAIEDPGNGHLKVADVFLNSEPALPGRQKDVFGGFGVSIVANQCFDYTDTCEKPGYGDIGYGWLYGGHHSNCYVTGFGSSATDGYAAQHGAAGTGRILSPWVLLSGSGVINNDNGGFNYKNDDQWLTIYWGFGGINASQVSHEYFKYPSISKSIRMGDLRTLLQNSSPKGRFKMSKCIKKDAIPTKMVNLITETVGGCKLSYETFLAPDGYGDTLSATGAEMFNVCYQTVAGLDYTVHCQKAERPSSQSIFISQAKGEYDICPSTGPKISNSLSGLTRVNYNPFDQGGYDNEPLIHPEFISDPCVYFRRQPSKDYYNIIRYTTGVSNSDMVGGDVNYCASGSLYMPVNNHQDYYSGYFYRFYDDWKPRN